MDTPTVASTQEGGVVDTATVACTHISGLLAAPGHGQEAPQLLETRLHHGNLQHNNNLSSPWQPATTYHLALTYVSFCVFVCFFAELCLLWQHNMALEKAGYRRY